MYEMHSTTVLQCKGNVLSVWFSALEDNELLCCLLDGQILAIASVAFAFRSSVYKVGVAHAFRPVWGALLSLK